MKEKRVYERYHKESQISYQFAYDAQTKVKYQVVESSRDTPAPHKFSAVSKNICASGLCFTSDQKLRKGQNLHLEVYLPEYKNPIHMDGEVRWSSKGLSPQKKDPNFDTGVKLLSVEGQSVDASVYFDQNNHVFWSNVLESIFGTFRKLRQEKQKVPNKEKHT